MDLWIRIQNKSRLIKAQDIYIINDCEILDNGHFLGRYNTNERALEVIDEIQSLIEKSSRVMAYSSPNKKEIESAFDVTPVATYISSEPSIIYPINQQCVVYEMPQE